MTTHAKKTFNHAMIYAVGNLMRHAVSFIMLPIYTRYLSPSDYGVVELLSMLVDFVGIILGMRIGEAVFRHYCMSKNEEEKNAVITSSLAIIALFNGIAVAVLITFSGFFSEIMYGDSSYEHIITLFSWTMLFATSEICYIYIRAIQKPWTFIIFNISHLVVQLSMNIYFVVILEMHVVGVVYSTLISGAILTMALLSYTLTKVRLKFSLNTSKRLITFSIPMMMAGLGAFYLTFGDRYFLRVYSDLNEVGIYSLGYKFGFILLVIVWNPFSKIWDSQKYEIVEKDNAVEIFQKTFTTMSLLLIGVAFGISLMVKDLLIIMSDKAFHNAHEIVPVILVAYIIQAWTAYSNMGILIKGNTSQIMYGTMLAIIAVTVSYFVLIPRFGAHGAAWGTLIGFIVRLYWINKKACESYDMHLPWKKVSSLLIVAISVYLVTYFVPEELLASVLSRALLFVVYVILLLKLPILNKNEKEILFRIVKNPISLKSIVNKQ